MKKTVLITGTSSGIGKAAARLFAAENWNVVATMRETDGAVDLSALGDVLVTRLDVQDRRGNRALWKDRRTRQQRGLRTLRPVRSDFQGKDRGSGSTTHSRHRHCWKFGRKEARRKFGYNKNIFKRSQT
jgi:hypothetical protein